MSQVLSQLINLAQVIVEAIVVIYIFRYMRSKHTKKFSIKLKDHITITTEYYKD